jgi:hypothetical protein
LEFTAAVTTPPTESLVYALELAASGVAAYAAAVWPDRPRGWVRKDLIEVRESAIAGLGVYAIADIPAGTIIGAYCGRLRSPAQMVAKCVAAPTAKNYCFKNGAGLVLDPTDESGEPSKWPQPGPPWPVPVDPTLCRVNEPLQASGGPSVSVEDDPGDPGGLVFVTAREIVAGEEVFVDYGMDYDRSGYG